MRKLITDHRTYSERLNRKLYIKRFSTDLVYLKHQRPGNLFTWSEINNHVCIFSRNIYVEFANNILIVAVLYQTVNVMRAMEITVVSMDNGSVVNRMFLHKQI